MDGVYPLSAAWGVFFSLPPYLIVCSEKFTKPFAISEVVSLFHPEVVFYFFFLLKDGNIFDYYTYAFSMY